MDGLISLQTVRDAATRLQPFVRRTPLIPTNQPGLFLKCENLQPVGAYNMLLQLSPFARYIC